MCAGKLEPNRCCFIQALRAVVSLGTTVRPSGQPLHRPDWSRSRPALTLSTESREICYPWHPWCGQSVWIHRTVVKSGRILYRCSLDQNREARLFEVLQWMFESGACCRVHSAEKPAVDRAAKLPLLSSNDCHAPSAAETVTRAGFERMVAEFVWARWEEWRRERYRDWPATTGSGNN